MVDTSLPNTSYIFNDTNDFIGRQKDIVVDGLKGLG